jgi:hypothetical protein
MRALLVALALLLSGCEPVVLVLSDSGVCDPAWRQLVDERLAVIERDLSLLQIPSDGGCTCR